MTSMFVRTTAKSICSLMLAILMVGTAWLERAHLAHCHGHSDSAKRRSTCHEHDADHAHACHGPKGDRHEHHANDVCLATQQGKSTRADFGTVRCGHDPSSCAICRHLGLTPHPATEKPAAELQLVAFREVARAIRAPALRVWERLPIRGPPTV